MKTYNFRYKNSSAAITITAKDYKNSISELLNLVTFLHEWRCENEDGESEEEEYNPYYNFDESSHGDVDTDEEEQ